MTNSIMLFITTMLEHTVRLVLDGDRSPAPRGFGSGVLVERAGRTVLLTAGHLLDQGQRWFVEVPTAEEGPTLLVPVNGPLRVLASFRVGEVGTLATQREDVAWAPVDLEALRRQAQSDPALAGRTVKVPLYRGPLNLKPVDGEAYGFASLTQPWLDGNMGHLMREPSFEFGMEYEGEAEDGEYLGCDVYRLGRPHQGHKYYRGASGAPIASAEGAIVSLLVGGDTVRDVVYGYPVRRIEPLIGPIG